MTLPRHRLLRMTVPAAVAAALALGAPTAEAKTLRHSDRVHDLVKFDENAGSQTADPGHVNGDVVSFKMWHSDTRVGIRVKFSELKRTGMLRGDLLHIVTNEGVKRDAQVIAGTADMAPHAWRGDAELDRPNGDRVRCAVSHSIDYAANVVQIGVPRSCLSAPRWVRLGYGAFSTGPDFSTGWGDDALLNGTVKDNLTLSSRLYRG